MGGGRRSDRDDSFEFSRRSTLRDHQRLQIRERGEIITKKKKEGSGRVEQPEAAVILSRPRPSEEKKEEPSRGEKKKKKEGVCKCSTR